jgi:hypothetical protein
MGDDEPFCDVMKPMIVQCACGKWEVQALLVGEQIINNGHWVLHGPERFASKQEAADTLAKRFLESCSPDQIKRLS